VTRDLVFCVTTRLDAKSGLRTPARSQSELARTKGRINASEESSPTIAGAFGRSGPIPREPRPFAHLRRNPYAYPKRAFRGSGPLQLALHYSMTVTFPCVGVIVVLSKSTEIERRAAPALFQPGGTIRVAGSLPARAGIVPQPSGAV